MLRDEAENLTRKAGREKHFILDTWYCGIINEKIRDATRKGQYEVKIRFDARSHVANHQQRFIQLYEEQGYSVHFRPNYVHITPSQYDMIIQWAPKDEENA